MPSCQAQLFPPDNQWFIGRRQSWVVHLIRRGGAKISDRLRWKDAQEDDADRQILGLVVLQHQVPSFNRHEGQGQKSSCFIMAPDCQKLVRLQRFEKECRSTDAHADGLVRRHRRRPPAHPCHRRRLLHQSLLLLVIASCHLNYAAEAFVSFASRKKSGIPSLSNQVSVDHRRLTRGLLASNADVDDADDDFIDDGKGSVDDDYEDKFSWQQASLLEDTNRKIEQQQEQIDSLLKALGQQGPNAGGQVSSSTASTKWEAGASNSQGLVPLKAMLFIDGTWLYYSLYERDEHQSPIKQQFGGGWFSQYEIDWSALPRIICNALQGPMWSTGQAQRPIEIVRVLVFTSFRKDTGTSSFRYKMFEEMKKANFDVTQLSTPGRSEKCVDIQIAVEMLHYATVPNAYDVALLLTGDKDFIPAMRRTRQKGRQVGLVSMSKAFASWADEPGLTDFDPVLLEDYLDILLVPKDTTGRGPRTRSDSSSGQLSSYTLMKVIYDFIICSGKDRVSSRDVGRYLKDLRIGSTNMLEKMKTSTGGLQQFLRLSGVFDTEYVRSSLSDNSFLIRIKSDGEAVLEKEAMRAVHDETEKEFFDGYSSDAMRNNRTAYFYTLLLNRDHHPLESNDGHRKRIMHEPHAESPSPPEVIDYNTLKVVELKEICRQRGLPVSGTKAVLIERLQTGSVEKSRDRRQDAIMYLTGLLLKFLDRAGGSANSGEIERYLGTMRSPQNPERTSLDDLNEIFGSVDAFLADVGNDERVVLEDATSSSNSMRRLRLNRRKSIEHSAPSGSVPDPKYLESLILEYLHARGGSASSRDIGRYLAANKASSGNKLSALQELKISYYNLKYFVREVSSGLYAANLGADSEFKVVAKERSLN